MLLRVLSIFLTLNLLCADLSFSQTTGILKGRVISGRTNESLNSATIRSLTDPAKGTATDADGIYSLILDTGRQQVICEYLGLATDTFTVRISADQVAEKDIQLTITSALLKTVVVSSGKFDQKLEELTVSMEVLKPSLINNKNTTSIETALEQVPGLTIIDNDPQIRGGSGFTFGVGSRVAILMDGIPMLSGDAGRPEWNYIPVENISQIEIIKGASSVLYGSSALSGVINVRTAYPTSKPKTIINYSVGAYSLPGKPAENWYGSSLPATMNFNFLHSRIMNKNLDLVIGGNFNMDQGYIAPPPPMPYIPWDLKAALKLTDSIPTFNRGDMMKIRGRLNFNLRYRSKKISGLNYGVNMNSMLNKTNMVFAWLDDSSGINRGYPGAVFMEDQAIFNIDPFVRYNNGNGTSHSLVMRVFHTDDKITNNQSTNGTIYYGEYQVQRQLRNIDFTITGGIVGSLAQSRAHLYASSGSPVNKTNNAAGYLQFDKKLWHIVNLSGGIRYEYFKTNNLEPVANPVFRGGVSVQVLLGTWIRASYGEGFRYPTITERYISTKAGLFGIMPNPGLKPETSNNFELGIKQGFKIGNCLGYIDIAGFDQIYHNTIEYLFGSWDTSVSLYGFKFVNTGNSRITGADISMACATPENDSKFGITALIGYTYVLPVSLTPDLIYAQTRPLFGSTDTLKTFKNSSMDTTGNVLKYRFKHMIKADIEIRIAKFGIGISYKYYSKMANIDKAFQDIETLTGELHYLDQIKVINYWKTHDGFHIFDARISYKLTEGHKLSLICNNLFNVTYFLRPLKIESPRTTAIQYVYTF